MRITIAKFGGNTINDTEKLDTAYSTVSTFVEKGEKVVAVVSAVRGVTNTLKETVETINKKNLHEKISRCIEELKRLHRHTQIYSEELSDLEQQFKYFVDSNKKPWIRDNILVKGEEIFSNKFTNKLNNGLKTILFTFNHPNFPTVAHGYFGNARVDLEKTKNMCEGIIPYFQDYSVLCIPGYGGIDRDSGRVKTLRRGGSDTVATALSYGFSANALWIITDVNGIKRAFTKKITDAPTIPTLCVEELRDAGVYGAKVPNEAAIRPLTFHCPQESFIAKYNEIDREKTRITNEREKDGKQPVELVAQKEIIIYEFNGVNLHTKISLLEAELDKNMIDFISLGGSDYTRKIAIPFDQEPYLDKSIITYSDETQITKRSVSLVGIIGRNMKETPGIIARMGSALAKTGINIYYQFDVSPVSCGVIVDKKQAEKSVELLYDEFKLSMY